MKNINWYYQYIEFIKNIKHSLKLFNHEYSNEYNNNDPNKLNEYKCRNILIDIKNNKLDNNLKVGVIHITASEDTIKKRIIKRNSLTISNMNCNAKIPILNPIHNYKWKSRYFNNISATVDNNYKLNKLKYISNNNCTTKDESIHRITPMNKVLESFNVLTISSLITLEPLLDLLISIDNNSIIPYLSYPWHMTWNELRMIVINN